ncbi:MAG TPA: hypothetical protein VKZ68_00560 [Ohtaekwangia sp.]|nr:hypothetical protein [Ohtaekwangia sp.]
MSSHHFVKEGQEPALFILDSVPFSEVSELLEWAPLLIITEDVLDAALSWSVKIDVVICSPGHQESVYARLQHQLPVEVQSIPQSDWIKSGVDYLQKTGYSNIHLLTQRRGDVFTTIDKAEAMPYVTIFENGVRWLRTKAYRKWVVAGQKFQVAPESIIPDLKIEGLALTLNEFHVTRDGVISITGPSSFWVGEKI